MALHALQHRLQQYEDTALENYPAEVIVPQCDECPRVSRYDKSALVDRFGPLSTVSTILTELCRLARPEDRPHHPRVDMPDNAELANTVLPPPGRRPAPKDISE